MVTVTNHLVRRGVDSIHASVRAFDSKITLDFDMPAWGITLILATMFFFAFWLLAIQYTYGELVATLAAVETPSSTAIIRTPPEDVEVPDAPLLSGDEKRAPEQEILLIQQKYLTSRFCTIMRHLRARGGRTARFRGYAISALNVMMYNAIMGFLTPLIRPSGWMFAGMEIVVYTLLTRFELLWNHIVISEPSQKSWLQRMPPRSVVAKALAPTAMYAAITRISTMAFLHLAPALGLNIRKGPQDQTITLFGGVALLALSLFMTIGIQIPAEIAIARVRASLLSEEDKPIIPFDRTFNGQVIPVAEGGKGVLTMGQALVGSDWATRWRVWGVYAKAVAMQCALVALGVVTVVGEIWLILGQEQTTKLAKEYAQHMSL